MVPLKDNNRLSCECGSGNSVRLAAKVTYALVHASDEEEDAWHALSTEAIHRFIQQATMGRGLSGLRVLNAGAGGLSYGLEACIHLDFSLGSLLRVRLAVSADLEHLCFAPASLDLVVCVGSVINYASANDAMAEFSRTIRIGGSLILEYERSESIIHLLSGAFGAHAKEITTSYKGHRHPMLVYSDRFISEILMKHGFSEERRTYFHVTPSLNFEKWSAGLMGRLDARLGGVPLLRRYAANCILECRRVPSVIPA